MNNIDHRIAYQQGYQYGRIYLNSENPYPSGTIENEKWEDGFINGAIDIDWEMDMTTPTD